MRVWFRKRVRFHSKCKHCGEPIHSQDARPEMEDMGWCHDNSGSQFCKITDYTIDVRKRAEPAYKGVAWTDDED